MSAKWPVLLVLATLLAGLAAGLARPVRADEHEPEWALREFAQAPRSQRNRVSAAELPADIATRLLAIVGAGVRGCDCLPRRLRWVWSLPRPSDSLHPSLVVSFEDRPRDHAQISVYERLALVAFKDGKYTASGVLTLNRPLPGADAALSVRMLPRRDFDRDGQLDIAVSFVETWKQASECGRVLFHSGSVQPVFEHADCPVED